MPANSATAAGLATRYATALFELALEQNRLDEVGRDLGAVERLLDESADLARLLSSPVVSRDEQGRAVAAVAERAGLAELTRNFLGVLAQKRRLFAFRQIATVFRQLLAAHRGEVAAEVVSAVPLNEEQRHYASRVVNSVDLMINLVNELVEQAELQQSPVVITEIGLRR